MVPIVLYHRASKILTTHWKLSFFIYSNAGTLLYSTSALLKSPERASAPISRTSLTLNCFSFPDNYNEQFKTTTNNSKASLWVPKWDPSYANLVVGQMENHFSTSTMAPNLNLTLWPQSIPFTRHCNFPKIQSLFSISKFLSVTTACLPAWTTTYRFAQLFVTFRIHSVIFSSFPRHSLNFLDFDVSVVITPIFFNKSEERCQFFKKHGYPNSVSNTAQHRAQQFERQSALQK